MTPKVWVVTGCSGGFGLAIAKEILRQGHKVIATSRNTNQMGELKDAGADVLALDVRAPLGEIQKIANTAHLLYGRVDVLINNAGFTRQGTLEELTYVQLDVTPFSSILPSRVQQKAYIVCI